MLKTLNVADLAIVREVSVEFEPGLTVVTGETGAGKSLLVDALGLLLGGRASGDVVRAGSRAARVEGVFSIEENAEAAALLAELGLEPEEGQVILAREVTAQGRSKVTINGTLNTLANLRRLGGALADIHGQHEHLRLTEPASQLELVDGYAGNSSLCSEVERAHAELRQLEGRLGAIVADDRDRAQRIDILTFQVREIEGAAARVGEDEELKREQRVLANAERVHELAEGSYQELYEQDHAVIERLAEIEKHVAELAAFEPSFEGARSQLETTRYALEDAALTLRDFAQRAVADPARAAEVDGRLDLLDRLKAKYGHSIEDVARFAEAARDELRGLVVSDEEKEALERGVTAARAAYAASAERLSEARREAAARLEREVEAELSHLALEKARFGVRLAVTIDASSAVQVGGKPVAYGSRGVDELEFLFAPNPGEPPRPLGSIASGGELARVQLALLSALQGRGTAPTSVYDEVDAGISGRVGDAVGRRLKALAASRQILCVTHLAQVGAHADQHVRVVKLDREGRSEVTLERLDARGRVEELASMLGGARVTAAGRRHAADLLSLAGEGSGGRRALAAARER